MSCHRMLNVTKILHELPSDCTEVAFTLNLATLKRITSQVPQEASQP
jgi:hypothetical protein